MNEITPNPTDGFSAEELANSHTETHGTEQTVTDQTEQETVDYQKKFSESSKEALRLLDEKKKLETELETYRAAGIIDGLQTRTPDTEFLYPGFEDLDKDSQDNLVAYTNAVTERAKKEILEDPSIAFAKKNYNDNLWETAFSEVLSEFPELGAAKDEFKSKSACSP